MVVEDWIKIGKTGFENNLEHLLVTGLAIGRHALRQHWVEFLRWKSNMWID
jgi:hypothetical protein